MVPVAEADVESVPVRRRSHGIEKLAVQLAAFGAMAASYFVLWRLVAPPDPAGPLVFLADGAPGRLSLLAGVLAALAALCGALTAGARPAGALTALAVGAGGLALHSQSVRALLWDRGANLAGMYWALLLELAVLAGLMLAAAAVLAVVRRLVLWAQPVAAWRESRAKGAKPAGMLTEFISDGAGGKEEALKVGWCFLADAAIAVALILVLARSNDRGQVLFALFGGCGLAAMLAQWVAPARSNLPALAAPLVVGAGLYVLAAAGAVEDDAQAWMSVAPYAQALPIDWVTAALGGSMLGQWGMLRMREAKAMEQGEQGIERGRVAKDNRREAG
jgi:hypothetical protein